VIKAKYKTVEQSAVFYLTATRLFCGSVSCSLGSIDFLFECLVIECFSALLSSEQNAEEPIAIGCDATEAL